MSQMKKRAGLAANFLTAAAMALSPLSAAPAHAGKNDDAALNLFLGFGLGVILGHEMQRNQQHHQAPRYYEPPPRHHNPRYHEPRYHAPRQEQHYDRRAMRCFNAEQNVERLRFSAHLDGYVSSQERAQIRRAQRHVGVACRPF